MAAFVILAHKDPEQVGRLAACLAPHHVLLHIDSAVPAANFADFQRAVAGQQHVRFTQRYRSAWGRWGIVDAALAGTRAALDLPGWTHVMFLSGQDYPIVSAGDITSFFDAHAGTSFLPSFTLPSDYWERDGGLHRVRYWHRPIGKKRFFIPIPRRFPAGIQPAGGSAFNCLTRDMAMRLLEFGQSRPDVPRFYRNTWIPDEMYVPTVVMHLAAEDETTAESLIHIRWSDPTSAHPDFLTGRDAAELIEAGRHGSDAGGWARRKLFARKIDWRTGAELLDILDREVHGRTAL